MGVLVIKDGGQFNPVKSIYPDGQPYVTVKELPRGETCDVAFIYKSAIDIIALVCTADALERNQSPVRNLFIPYFPFARSDRKFGEGEGIPALQMAFTLNAIRAQNVEIVDPHSDLIENCVSNAKIITQAQIYQRIIRTKFLDRTDVLVAPDLGAYKKLSQYADQMMTFAYKTRHEENIYVRLLEKLEPGKNYFIIDDICDGGGTFIELAKVLRSEADARKISLFVTHGIFSRGLNVFDGLIDNIYTTNTRDDKFTGKLEGVVIK